MQLSNSSEKPENILGSRYASKDMLRIWSKDSKVLLERQLWLAVLETQKEFGLNKITDKIISDYRNVINKIDHDSIRKIEEKTRHDVKARIEEFNRLAGHELIHMGMTSRDLTDNIEQLQIKLSLELISTKTVSLLREIASTSDKYKSLVMAGRSHNVPAQPTTLGKKLSNYGEEIIINLSQLNTFTANYPLRGIKGPVGTQQDMKDLMGLERKELKEFEDKLVEKLGFKTSINSVGQVYPRSLDSAAISRLTETTSGVVNLANQIRLLAGQDLATEGFKKNQVGSSAMPHKMNARTCERIWSLHAVLKGYQTTAANLAGSQWNEGDVSCSAARRVIFPDAFFAADGIINSALVVLDEFGAYEKAIDKELRKYLPFLATTKIMMAAIQAGVGREAAHEVIKKHAIAVVGDMRNGLIDENDFLSRLDEDPEFDVDIKVISKILENPIELAGQAEVQVEQFIKEVKKLVKLAPESAKYKAEGIL